MATFNPLLISHIKEAEGLRCTAYRCPAGRWTIGYGHTLDVRRGMVINGHRAEELLLEDVARIVEFLLKKFPWLNENQVAALADFVFNVGQTAFEKSTLYMRIEWKADDEAVCRQLLKWQYYHQGKQAIPSAGLLKRRQWECAMWKGQLQ